MTIHTKWMELLREEARDAFEYGQLSVPVQAGFVDGQIKLMISADPTLTWADFLRSKFASVLMRHFHDHGCSTVVLAFDDRRHVPRAKAITQLKRRAGVNVIEFGEADVLPNQMPAEWRESIMNPWFKHRVLELVCTNVPRLISPPEGSKLIVDWETVVQYTYTAEEPEVAVLENAPIGEADLKFPRWMQALQCPMLVEATDGDYIPIAFGLKAAGFDYPIAILKAWRHEQGHEFVCVDRLYDFIRRKFHAAARAPGPEWWEVKLFIALLGLSGTDFTRNLPLVSPAKMWASLPLIVRTFQMEDDVRIHMAQGKRLVELLYAEAFPKHIDCFAHQSVWTQAQASKLGQRNKALIPTDRRIECTLRNVNFLLAYWLRFAAPERIEEYGFRLEGGGVAWDD